MKKEWDIAYARISMPERTRNGSWIINNARNFRYAPGIVAQEEWEAMIVTPGAVERAWYYVASLEQFGPMRKFFAHTFIGFELQDGTRVAFSAEARLHKGESYDPFVRGMFGAYEITYLWGELDDFETRRTLFQKQTLERYALTLPRRALAALVEAALENTQRAAQKRERYYTITNQCTIALMKAFTLALKETNIPWSPAWHITGLSAEFLARRGILDLSSKETLS